jgi:hypothetical protein
MSTSLLDGVLSVFAAYVSGPVDFPSGLDGKSDAAAARVSCSGSKDGLTASSVISYCSPSLSPKSVS